MPIYMPPSTYRFTFSRVVRFGHFKGKLGGYIDACDTKGKSSGQFMKKSINQLCVKYSVA